MIWGPILAWYLFLAGLSAGAYTTAALANFKDPENTRKFQLGGRLIAVVAVIVGLLLLIVDAEAGLHNPVRFFYLLTNWNSVMTWGTAILAVFTVIACLSALLMLLKKRVPKALDYIGIFLALCTAAYTGVLIGVVETYPLWNNALLPVLFVVSGFSAGLAATFLASTFFAHEEAGKLVSLKKFHFSLPIIEICLIGILLYITATGSVTGTASVSLLTSGNLSMLFWGGLIVIGLLLPIVIEFVTLFVLGKKNKTQGSDLAAAESGGVLTLEAIGGAGTLVGGFLLRYLILMAAVPLTFLV